MKVIGEKLIKIVGPQIIQFYARNFATQPQLFKLKHIYSNNFKLSQKFSIQLNKISDSTNTVDGVLFANDISLMSDESALTTGECKFIIVDYSYCYETIMFGRVT